MLLKISSVLVIALIQTINGRSISDRTCIDPDMSKLKVDISELHDSFYQLPNMQNLLDKINVSSTSKFIAIRYGYMHGPKQCPSYQALIDHYGGHLCPVYYVHNNDENRIPESFVEARCSCKAPPLENSSKDKIDYKCAPLVHYIQVRRRVTCDQNGYYEFRKVLEPIQIGCFTRIPIRSLPLPPVQGP